MLRAWLLVTFIPPTAGPDAMVDRVLLALTNSLLIRSRRTKPWPLLVTGPKKTMLFATSPPMEALADKEMAPEK